MENGVNEVKNKGNKKVLIIGISSVIALCAIIGLIVVLILTSKTKINLNDYLEISYSGFNGVGEVDYDIDVKRLIEDFSEELGLETKNQQINFEWALDEYISGKLSETKDLSNGDTVSFKWEVNDKIFEDKYKCVMEYKDVKEEVKTLQEPEEYDPFEKLGVFVDGMAPSGQTRLDKSSIEYTGLTYEATPMSGLKNGDKITVTVQYDEEIEKYCLGKGIKLTSTEKEYTVSGLSAYVSSIDEVSEEKLTEMKKQSEDVFRAYAATNWEEPDSIKEFKYIGSYLLNSKGNIGYMDADNYLYLVFNVNVSNSQGDLSYYYYTRFSDLIIDGNGEVIVDVTKYTVPTGGYHMYYNVGPYGEAFEHNTYWYLGYETLDGLFNTCVTANLEKYSYESSVN